jgi:hypothetical protein
MAIVVLLVPLLLRESLPIVLAVQIIVGVILYGLGSLALQRAKLVPILDGLRS